MSSPFYFWYCNSCAISLVIGVSMISSLKDFDKIYIFLKWSSHLQAFFSGDTLWASHNRLLQSIYSNPSLILIFWRIAINEVRLYYYYYYPYHHQHCDFLRCFKFWLLNFIFIYLQVLLILLAVAYIHSLSRNKIDPWVSSSK